MSVQRVSDLKTRILEAQQGNKTERKAEKTSAMKSKAAKKKKIQEEHPLSPESDMSEPDEDFASRDKKAGLCWAARWRFVIDNYFRLQSLAKNMHSCLHVAFQVLGFMDVSYDQDLVSTSSRLLQDVKPPVTTKTVKATETVEKPTEVGKTGETPMTEKAVDKTCTGQMEQNGETEAAEKAQEANQSTAGNETEKKPLSALGKSIQLAVHGAPKPDTEKVGEPKPKRRGRKPKDGTEKVEDAKPPRKRAKAAAKEPKESTSAKKEESETITAACPEAKDGISKTQDPVSGPATNHAKSVSEKDVPGEENGGPLETKSEPKEEKGDSKENANLPRATKTTGRKRRSARAKDEDTVENEKKQAKSSGSKEKQPEDQKQDEEAEEKKAIKFQIPTLLVCHKPNA